MCFFFVKEGYALPCTSPTLTEGQVQRIAECALILARTLPDYEPKLVQNKKKISRELLLIMEMASNNLSRLDEFRKYAAIYGRFDAKRKADKPLTLHEVRSAKKNNFPGFHNQTWECQGIF